MEMLETSKEAGDTTALDILLELPANGEGGGVNFLDEPV